MMGKVLRETWGVVALLGAWQVWVTTSSYNPIIVVGPMPVVRDLLGHPGLYLRPAMWTLGFAVAGLALGMLAGVGLAVIGWSSALFTGLMQPAVLLVSATPVVCLIPLLARAFGYESRTELVTVAMMTSFPSYVYAGAGLRRAPAKAREVFQALGASRVRELRYLALPAAIPEIAIALRVGAAYSVLVTVVAEYLMQTGGLGAMFAVTMQQFHLPRALGTSVIAIGLSVVLYSAAGVVEGRAALRWGSRG